MNLYLKAPLVLGGICVVSAGLLGGVNYLAEQVKKNQGDEAPKAIKDLDPNASFQVVEGFEPFSVRGEAAKVTIENVYTILEGGSRTGYAYQLNCGKGVKSEIKFNVAYKGEISESTVNDVKPFSVVTVSIGDPGYDTNAGALLDGVVNGSASMNDNSSIVAGGTVSQKFVLDGLRVARTDYLSRWNGGGGPGPVDETLTLIQGVFSKDEVVSYALDEGFEELSFRYRDVAGDTQTGKVTKRYTVKLESDKFAKVYQGTGAAVVQEGSPEELSVDLMVGFQGEVAEGGEKEIQPNGYKVVASDFSYSQWQDAYLPGIVGGSIDLDDNKGTNTGATISSQLVRQMMIAMRKDYYKVALAAQAANVEADFRAIFGDQFDAFAKDADFTAIQADLKTENGTYDVLERYTITLKDGASAKAYKGKTACTFEAEGNQEGMSTTIIAGFSGEDGKLVGISKKAMTGFGEWETGYIPGIVDGSASLDDESAAVGSGATRSAKAVRELLLAMREDYRGGQAQ